MACRNVAQENPPKMRSDRKLIGLKCSEKSESGKEMDDFGIRDFAATPRAVSFALISHFLNSLFYLFRSMKIYPYFG